MSDHDIRGTLSLLFHAEKALDVVGAALDLGILARLDEGPATLDELCAASGAKRLRMYKFMDCLESLGMVRRDQSGDALESARYRGEAPLAAAARAVLGPSSIERDRDTYGWRELRGELPSALRGERSISSFDWPPKPGPGVDAFEASMAAGCIPIVESFRAASHAIFGGNSRVRWLDVGGGDGTLAAALAREHATLIADVYNLPSVEPLVRARSREASLESRIGFVGGDFLAQPLPGGYDVMSFVRVLHDWPAETARALLVKAKDALEPGAKLVICEEFRNPQRLKLQFFWTYFLIGVDACVSRLREISWYWRALETLGFRDIEVIPGAFDILIATRR